MASLCTDEPTYYHPPPQLMSVTMSTYKQDEGKDVKEQKLAKDSYHPCAEKS